MKSSTTPWRETDVLVVGAGAAGVPAAIGAARAGARVILLEEDAVPGGAAVDQYVSMPDGGPRSGVVAEYVRRLEARHALAPHPVDRWWYYWYLPSAYVQVMEELLAAEPRLEVICGARAEEPLVETRDGRPVVVGARLPAPDGGARQIRARVVIDATGTGLFAHQAGCETLYGEDAREDFGEPQAPPQRTDRVQLLTWMYVCQKIGGGPALDFSRLQHKPLESGFATVSADLAGARQRDCGIYLNWGCRVRCADTRDEAALAQAQRQALAEMADDLRLLRENGYAVHLAPRIGVREQRRVLGESVVTFVDMLEGRIPEDTITVTSRPTDIWTENKSQMQYPETKTYGIPYRALIPRGVEGLLVAGKHLSGTHLAMGSYRVQCILGTVGQAAGVAAAHAARDGGGVREVKPAALIAEATAAPQNLVLDPAACTPPGTLTAAGGGAP
jgi:hypothetical protein